MKIGLESTRGRVYYKHQIESEKRFRYGGKTEILHLKKIRRYSSFEGSCKRLVVICFVLLFQIFWTDFFSESALLKVSPELILTARSSKYCSVLIVSHPKGDFRNVGQSLMIQISFLKIKNSDRY